MTDDLVKRLQMWARECEEQHGPGMWSQDMRLSANRIEELEKRIKLLENEIENLEYEMCELENNR